MSERLTLSLTVAAGLIAVGVIGGLYLKGNFSTSCLNIDPPTCPLILQESPKLPQKNQLVVYRPATSESSVIYSTDRQIWTAVQSPNGKNMAIMSFSSNYGSDTEIQVLSLDTDKITSSFSLNEPSNGEISWSKNGDRIAFSAIDPPKTHAINDGGISHIYLSRPDGNDLVKLPIDYASQPQFSPVDDSMIAYTCCNPNQKRHVLVSKLSGIDQKQVADTIRLSEGFSPSWSSDGKYIGFTSANPNTHRLSMHVFVVQTGDDEITPDLSFPVWSGDKEDKIAAVFEEIAGVNDNSDSDSLSPTPTPSAGWMVQNIFRPMAVDDHGQIEVGNEDLMSPSFFWVEKKWISVSSMKEDGSEGFQINLIDANMPTKSKNIFSYSPGVARVVGVETSTPGR